MKLKFKNQDFQTAAVSAVTDLLAGQEHTRATFSTEEVRTPYISSGTLSDNMCAVRDRGVELKLV